MRVRVIAAGRNFYGDGFGGGDGGRRGGCVDSENGDMRYFHIKFISSVNKTYVSNWLQTFMEYYCAASKRSNHRTQSNIQYTFFRAFFPHLNYWE